MNSPAVKWYGINALEIRHNKGSFMIDPYVSRDNRLLHIPGEVDIRYGSAAVIGRLCVIGSGIDKEKIKELFGV